MIVPTLIIFLKLNSSIKTYFIFIVDLLIIFLRIFQSCKTRSFNRFKFINLLICITKIFNDYNFNHDCKERSLSFFKMEQFFIKNKSDQQHLENSNNYPAKIVLVGDVGSGKTSLIRRFIFNTFDSPGCKNSPEYYETKVWLKDGTAFPLQIWDNAEKFENITDLYYTGTQAYIICMDLSNTTQYDNLNDWLYALDQCMPLHDPVPIFLVGTKSDLVKLNGSLDITQIMKGFAARNHLRGEYHKTSALKYEGITGVFTEIAQIIHDENEYKKSLLSNPMPLKSKLVTNVSKPISINPVQANELTRTCSSPILEKSKQYRTQSKPIPINPQQVNELKKTCSIPLLDKSKKTGASIEPMASPRQTAVKQEHKLEISSCKPGM